MAKTGHKASSLYEKAKDRKAKIILKRRKKLKDTHYLSRVLLWSESKSMRLVKAETSRSMEQNRIQKQTHAFMVNWVLMKLQSQCNRERIVFSTNAGCNNWTALVNQWKFTTHSKVNSKWPIVLNVKPKSIKLLQENKQKNLCDLMWGRKRCLEWHPIHDQ